MPGSPQRRSVCRPRCRRSWAPVGRGELSGTDSNFRRGTTMAKADNSQGGESAAQLIDEKIKELGDWRGETLARVRTLIKQADPKVVEECKWRKQATPTGVPVWSHDGLICTGETYKSIVKLTFAKGAQLK